MGKALSPGDVTEQVSMKEQGLEQGLDERMGYSEVGASSKRTVPCRCPGPTSEH